MKIFKLTSALRLLVLSIPTFAQKGFKKVNPGEVWPDDKNEHIQTHRGGIIKRGSTCYGFGGDRRKNNSADTKHVGCYASEDLVNWNFVDRHLSRSHWKMEENKPLLTI